MHGLTDCMTIISGRSWWKKIDDNSRDVQELLESKDLVEVNNLADEFDVEVLR